MSGFGLHKQRPKGVTAKLTKYFYVLTAEPEQTIERVPALLTPLAKDAYGKIKSKLVEMYDLSNYQRAKLLAALPPAACDVNPSELMDRMLALLPPKEQAKPYIMFTHTFLTRLPAHTCTHCVPIAANGLLVELTRRGCPIFCQAGRQRLRDHHASGQARCYC